MNSKYNHYKVTLEHTHNPKGDELQEAVSVEFDNHDNIFNIIKILQEKNLFSSDSETAEFAIGLKMFGEVMLRNRENPLFSELSPAFKEFMMKLKST
ncbi:DUF3861 domain-containing protein [Flavobacterium rakeshii]|uniref:DUF3861 domain-containing protein n=1 Tax=Flavobacterium rakeshii TaxID=1038845 RepID=UPI002E7C3210|nr:DUF3861 domain-containing protein [Flavobacterium rakeshii]MEE1899744.1 DUF3861 domain-containing protein [Flavobacterium rakeshii]